jgi:protein Mpv17
LDVRQPPPPPPPPPVMLLLSNAFAIAAAWAAYASALATRPLATKAATSAVLSIAGDLAAQTAGEGKPLASVDVARTARFGALGAGLVGPALHFWYGALARALPASTTGAALARLAADQLAFAPVFLSTFIAALGALEGAGPAECAARVADGIRPTLLANWCLWVPANFLNFRLVPPPLQVGFANLVALGWNTYLSLSQNAGR